MRLMMMIFGLKKNRKKKHKNYQLEILHIDLELKLKPYKKTKKNNL